MIEKEMFEDAFDMRGGYVLDFNNRTFGEFIAENLGFDVWADSRYAQLSKAKALRAILKDSIDTYAGKLLIALIQYRQFKQISNAGDKHVEAILDLAQAKLGRASERRKRNAKSASSKATLNVNYKRLEADLLSIESNGYNAQQKGYAFERYLSTLFEAFDLRPRTSYKTEFDQTDGSFEWNANTVLVEAKYRGVEPSKNDLILFNEKLCRNSASARGVFICLTRPSDNTITFFLTSKDKKFIVITVEELYLMCNQSIDFKEILRKKFRCLDETGVIFKHISSL